jgi:hypothetical protein
LMIRLWWAKVVLATIKPATARSGRRRMAHAAGRGRDRMDFVFITEGVVGFSVRDMERKVRF